MEMGKDRRKKDASRKQVTAAPATSSVLSEPKGQREPRKREKEAVKQPDPTTTPPAPVETGQPDTAELFANLKRETDEIKALNTKKFPRRQITSNWERYDEPLPTPEYEVGLQGADFESLVHAPMSEGGHFKFNSERSWDSNVEALSGQLFSLDVDYLADGLATIPLYLQLDLPVTLLSVTELEELDDNAKQCVGHYESIKKNISRKRDKRKGGGVMDVTAGHILDILMMKEPSPAPTEESSTDKKTSALTFDIEDGACDTDQNIKMSDAEKTGEVDLKKTDTARAEVSRDVERNSPAVSSDDRKHAPQPADYKSKPSNRAFNPPVELVVNTGNKIDSSSVQLSTEPDKSKLKSADEVPSTIAPKTEVVEISNETEVDEAAQSWTEKPAVPLGQRSGGRKPRGKTQPPERQNPKEEKPKVEKPKADDDLDFLLSLKKPVRESHISALQPSQVTKPTIDDDDSASGASSSQLPLVAPQKHTEDLEDWLDSMLDD